MQCQCRGPSEDCDVKAERLRVDEALARGGSRGGRELREGQTERDTVLIRGLAKVGVCTLHKALHKAEGSSIALGNFRCRHFDTCFEQNCATCSGFRHMLFYSLGVFFFNIFRFACLLGWVSFWSVI